MIDTPGQRFATMTIIRAEVAGLGCFMAWAAWWWPPGAGIAIACAVFCTRPWLHD